MDEKVFSEIVTVSSAIAEQGKVEVLRDQSRLIVEEIQTLKQGVFIVAGLRGTGKTTLLAYIYAHEKDALFINAEMLLRHSIELLDCLHYAMAKGYKTIFIDEIHVFSGWEKDIKIFYDETRAKIVISGSSAIALRAKGSELSRRARTFRLAPLSFREYLQFKTEKRFPVITIKEIITRRVELEKQIRPYFAYFQMYCSFDALPAAYFEQNKEIYLNILERIARYDLIHLREIDTSYIENVFRAVRIIVGSPPGELSYSGLASALGIGIKLARTIIYSLEQAGVVYLVSPAGVGKKAVRKEEKILMPLSFRAALCAHYSLPLPTGGVREDFFVQHVGTCFYLKTGKERRTPDFVVDGKVFEIGGSSKSMGQITSMENAYLVKEEAVGSDKEIPLYLFGFLY